MADGNETTYFRKVGSQFLVAHTGMMTRLSLFCIIVLSYVQLENVKGRQGVGAGEQEWDFVEVRPGAHMFWWLYYTTNKNVMSYEEKPLVIWLQGGPGTSGTGYGNFKELGPYDENLNPRNLTWVKDFNLLFIDNPVGTGFSYLEDEVSYSKTNMDIARDLLECMSSFYEKLPEFRRVPVYIMSVSYGGKMAAEFALRWYKSQKSGLIDSNLRGVGLGDSWISPIDSVLTWAPYLLNLGMIDEDDYDYITTSANKTRHLVEEGHWSAAFKQSRHTMGTIVHATRGIDSHNILTRRWASVPLNEMMPVDAVLDELMNGDVRDALNVSEDWILQNMQVYEALDGEFMRPVTDIVEQLLDDTTLRVFVYNGQLDMVTATPGTLKWINKLNSEHIKRWKKELRVSLIIDGFIEGFKKCSTKFCFYWVHRAGHNVAADNPAAAFAILKDLTLEYNNNLFN